MADRRREPERGPLYVIDASALLAAFLPEEEWEAEADALLDAYQEGAIRLVAPTLLPYEVLNSLYIAVRGKAGKPPRISEEEAKEAWEHFCGLRIPLHEVEEVGEDALELALRQRWRSVYHLAYVALAQRWRAKLISVDRGLVEAFPEQVQALGQALGEGATGE